MVFGRVTVALALIAAACSREPRLPTDEAEQSRSSTGVEEAPRGIRVPPEEIKDVQGVAIDRPPEPRDWDTSAVALEKVLAANGGHAIIAFKAAESARSLTTGYRAAVPAAAIREALEVLYERHVAVMHYYARMGAAHVVLPPGVATELFSHPLIDYIEPPQTYSLGIGVTR